MPPTLFDRIPFATLQNFVLFSFVGFGSCLFFAWSNAKDYMIESMNSTKNFTDLEYDLIFNSLTFSQYTRYLTMAVTSQFWTILTLINMCCCILALIGKGIQLIVFGTLRVSELQQLRERFWNFVFYKFIFIFGILNVQYMSDALMWTAWFTLLCSLQMLAQLCKYRFEYLSCSPATPKAHHIKLISLLTIILLLSFCLIAASITTAIHTDWNIFFFMVAECLLLTVKTSYVLTKYGIYLIDINHDGLWETRGSLAYYTDLSCELAVLIIDLSHYLHMVIWSNIFLSMASLVILMQVRHLFNELQKRISRHRNYQKVVKSMEARFAEATDEEIMKYDDSCAICWDKMQRARKLPCGHLFHNPCLRSWLAQDISCPTCRVSLSEQKTRNLTEDEEVIRQMDNNNDAMVRHRDRPLRQDDEGRSEIRNHFFEFDATQYISWLPRFSVAVTRLTGRQPVQLNSMAREVQNLFPSISLASILEDLRTTQSVEITVDNILEGRLIILTNGSDDSSEYESDSEDNVESVTEQANPTPAHTETGNSNPQLHTNTPYEDYPASSATDTQDNQELFPEDPNSRHQLLQGRKLEMQNVGLRRYYAQNRNEASSSHASNAAETEDNKNK